MDKMITGLAALLVLALAIGWWQGNVDPQRGFTNNPTQVRTPGGRTTTTTLSRPAGGTRVTGQAAPAATNDDGTAVIIILVVGGFLGLVVLGSWANEAGQILGSGPRL